MLFFQPRTLMLLHHVTHPMYHACCPPFSTLHLFVTPMHVQYMFPLASRANAFEVTVLESRGVKSPLVPIGGSATITDLRHKRVSLWATWPFHKYCPILTTDHRPNLLLHLISRIQHLDKISRCPEKDGSTWRLRAVLSLTPSSLKESRRSRF